MLRKILFLSVIVTVLILSMITTEDLYAKKKQMEEIGMYFPNLLIHL
jgi:hypothetical protein